MPDRLRSTASFDVALRDRVSVTLEVLMNLTHLTRVQANDVNAVARYMDMADERIAELVNFMRTNSASVAGWPPHDKVN